jgi:hypothetical protein
LVFRKKHDGSFGGNMGFRPPKEKPYVLLVACIDDEITKVVEGVGLARLVANTITKFVCFRVLVCLSFTRRSLMAFIKEARC